MLVNTEEILNRVIDEMNDVMKIGAKDIPNIDLYMDQVTTFMDQKLRSSLRGNDSEEKILTKTMINNYAKNDFLPPPVKKKYTKEHMMVLIFVYYFKSFLTISDINTILEPLTGKYFNTEDDFTLEDIYEEVFGVGGERMNRLKEDLSDKYRASQLTFENAPEEDREYLQIFAYICFLSYDVFVKRLLIERLIDEINSGRSNPEDEEDGDGTGRQDKKSKDKKDKDKKDKDKKDKDRKSKDKKDKDKKTKDKDKKVKDKKDKDRKDKKDKDGSVGNETVQPVSDGADTEEINQI